MVTRRPGRHFDRIRHLSRSLSLTPRWGALRSASCGATIALLVALSPLASAAPDVSTTGDANPAIPATSSPVDLTGTRLLLGGTTGGPTPTGLTGALNVSGGGNLNVAQIAAGFGGLGTGTVTIDGAGSIVTILRGASPNSGLDIGSWGTGSMSVTGGASVVCTVANCQFNDIGGAAGSSGTLTISGAGSSVTGMGLLNVGQANVQSGGGYGTPGGSTTGTLNVLSGGILGTIGGSTISAGAFGAPNGFEHTDGNVIIRGTGSMWSVTEDPIGPNQARINMAATSNATATLTVDNGGQVNVTGGTIPSYIGVGDGGAATLTIATGGAVSVADMVAGNQTTGLGTITVGGTGSTLSIGNGLTVGNQSTGANSLTVNTGGTVTVGGNNGGGLAIAQNTGSQGAVTVNGGTLNVSGTNPGIGVGNGGAGTLTIQNGGIVTISGANGGMGIGGAPGSSGTVLVDGIGSQLNVQATNSGVGVGNGGTGVLTVQNNGHLNAVNMGVGSGGNGTLNVLSGGQVSVTGMGLGNQTTGVGTVTVGGASSVLTIAGPITVGQQNAGANALTINSGGTVTMTGANPGGLAIAQATGSHGAVTVNGGTLSLAAPTGGIGVGNGGTGTLTVQNSGQVTVASNAGIGVAGSLGSTGTVLVDNGQISLTGSSAFFGVGNGGGGSLTVQNGGTVSMTGANSGMGIGGPTGSSGSLTIKTGGTVTINGTGGLGVANSSGTSGTALVDGGTLTVNGSNAFFGVGNGGTGTLTLTNGGSVSAVNFGLGNQTTGVGTATVGGGVGQSVLTVSNSMGVGNSSTALSQLTINAGGAVNVTGSGLGVAGSIGSNGSVLVDGGQLSVSGASSGIGIGNQGTGSLTVQNAGNVTMAGQNFGITVGGNGSGTMNVNTGSSITTEQLVVAGGQSSTGVVNIVGATTGQQTIITLNGPASNSNGSNPLQVGNWGNGTMTVSNGAIVNAAIGNGNCGPAFCNNYVGNAAGSTGSLTLTGANTTMNLGGGFVVGNAAVFTNPPNNFGTPGGTTNATLQVLNGATLNTHASTVSTGPTGPNASGSEHTVANVTIDGVGSTWNITRDPVTGAQATLVVAGATNATATIEVRNGAQIVITGSLPNNATPGLVIGGNGGVGTVNVHDAGSAIVVNGPLERDVIVGNAPGSQGTLTVSNGAQITASWFGVGNNGGTGTSTIDNATVLLNGLALNPPGQPDFGASVRVGRGSGSTGTLNLVNGAQLVIDTATDGSAINLGGTLTALGGTGTLNMSGASSISFIGGGATPAVNIGHSGTGLFTMTGNSTLSLPNDGSIVLGNRAAGNGTLQLGGGSTIDTGLLYVGNNGHGTVTMTGGTLGVHGTDPNIDAFFVVGANNGAVGTFAQSGGAVSANSPLILGWQTGSSGSYTLSGGTLTTRQLTVADRGTGVFVNNAINNVNGLLIIGGDLSANGSYTITGNSAQTNVNFASGGLGQTDPPGLNGYDSGVPRHVPNGALGVGIGGTGTFTQGNFSDPGNTVNVAGDLAVGVFAGGLGTYTLNTGALTVDGKIVIGGQSQSNNVFTQNGGSVTVTGAASGNANYTGLGGNDFSGSLIVGGGINDLGGGTGTYVLHGGTVTADLVQVGLSGTGTFNQTGGTVSTPTLWLGNCGGCNGGNATGTYNLTGTGVVNASSESIGLFGHGEFTQNGAATRNNVAGTLALGEGPKATPDTANFPRSGLYTLVSGQLNTQGTVVGSQGVGTFNQSGGLHTVGGNLTLGRDNPALEGSGPVFGGPAIGTYTQTGGVVTIGSAYNGQVLANGQTVATAATGTLTVGAAGNGTYNIGTSGQTNNTQWGGYPGNSPGTPPPAFDNATNAPYVQVFGNVVVGRDAGSTGAINLAGTGSTLAATGDVIIGDAGTGTFTQNGGTHTIGGALVLGSQASGNGSYAASNGASITLTSSGAQVVIGDNGSGLLTMVGGSTLTISDNGKIIVGANAGATGQLELQGNSSINAGANSVFGIGHDGTPGGSTGGSASVYVDSGSSITATNIYIGAAGCLGGNGGILHGNVVMDGETSILGCSPPTLAVSSLNLVGPTGILHPGRSPGVITIDGGFDFISGTIELEIASDGHGGFVTDEIIFTHGTLLDLMTAHIEFSFLGDADPNLFAKFWNLDTFLKTVNDVGGIEGISALGDLVSFADATFVAESDAYVFTEFTFNPDAPPGQGGATFDAVKTSGSVPEPGTMMLMLLGGALLLFASRRGKLAQRATLG